VALTLSSAQTLSLLSIIGGIEQRQNNLLTQLTTGQLINKASDDPAGLIAATNLNTELTAVQAALENNQRTDSMLDVATGALSEISSLLSEIERLSLAAASPGSLTAAELAANQAQIDEAIESIDRIVQTTTFNGARLLDGSLGIQATGVDTTKISDLRIYSRPSNSTGQTITVSLQAAATKAQVVNFATTSATTSTTIAITGKLGTTTIDIAAGENLSSIAASIQAAAGLTGVTASAAADNSALHLISQEYGTDAFISVQNLSGDSTNFSDVSKTAGTDAEVTVNGQNALVDGLNVNFTGNGVSLSFTLTENYNNGVVSGNESFTVSGGGATFQLGTESSTRATIGINSLYSYVLGESDLGFLSSIKSGGSNDLDSDPSQAVAIVKKAIQQVAVAQARIGAFQRYQVQSSINVLTTTKESLQEAHSNIMDVDVAQATAELTRQKTLMSAATSVLGIANNNAQLVLNLLQ